MAGVDIPMAFDLAGVETAGSRWQPGSSAQQAQGREQYSIFVSQLKINYSRALVHPRHKCGTINL